MTPPALPMPPAPPAAPGHPVPAAAAAGPARRRPTGPGLGSVLVGAAIAGVGTVAVWAGPRGLLLVALLPAQLLLAWAWIGLTGVPARRAGAAVAGAAGLAADLLLVAEHRPELGGLAGVVGLGVVAAVLGQLVRRERTRVTDVLAAQVSAVLLAVASAPSLALAARPRGDRATAVGLLAIATCLLAGELGARAAPRRSRAARALVGLALGGLIAAAVGGIAVAGTGAAVAGAAALATVLAVLVAELAAVSGAPAVAVLLPFSLAGPCAYVVGAVMLR